MEDYCSQGLHVRDAGDQYCLECGDHKGFAERAAELVANEPPRGSAVITEGPLGTVWQRLRGSGRWHSTTGKSTTWSRLILSNRPGSELTLIYLPPIGRP